MLFAVFSKREKKIIKGNFYSLVYSLSRNGEMAKIALRQEVSNYLKKWLPLKTIFKRLESERRSPSYYQKGWRIKCRESI